MIPNTTGIFPILIRIVMPTIARGWVVGEQGINLSHILGNNNLIITYLIGYIAFIILSLCIDQFSARYPKRQWEILHHVLDALLTLINVLINLYVFFYFTPSLETMPEIKKLFWLAFIIFVTVFIDLVAKLFTLIVFPNK
jgi:hypothetical protein